jgi:hypothetical protein
VSIESQISSTRIGHHRPIIDSVFNIITPFTDSLEFPNILTPVAEGSAGLKLITLEPNKPAVVPFTQPKKIPEYRPHELLIPFASKVIPDTSTFIGEPVVVGPFQSRG